MPFNGSGVYTPIGSPDFPAVAATTIRAAQYNNEINDLASALTNCVTRDGQSPATADLPMGGMKHTNVAAAALRTQYARAAEVQDGTLTYLTNVVGANAITAVAPLALAAYSTGQTFRFVAAEVNTGAATLNINGLGAKAITKQGATALVAGDILAGSIVQVTYDGAQFQLQTPAFLSQAFQGANQALSANGYQKLPSGLIVQWGLTPGAGSNLLQTVTFPLAFPTAVYLVSLQYVDGSVNSGAGRGNPTQIGISNTAAFNFYHSGTANNCQFYWFAIGK